MTPWQWIAAIGGGMAAILLPIRLWREAVTHWSSLREWLGRRRLRREKIDELIGNSGQAHNICEILTGIQTDVGDIKDKIASMENDIAESREERKRHSGALLILFDTLTKEGFNGPIGKAKEELQNYLVEMSH